MARRGGIARPTKLTGDMMANTIRSRIETALEICKSGNEELFAFSTFCDSTALAAADYLDAMRSNGTTFGALHGIAICVKDIFDVAGVPTRAGSLARANQPPAADDAFAVSKLRAAGAVIVAKANTVEFALGGWGTNKNIGTPRNPWGASEPHTPGGTSSGTAVAVGGGLLPAGLGSDTGGSIRVPAAFCGCVGLKTSIGLVSRTGVVPLSNTFDTVGPITDTVLRAAQMLDVIQGEDRCDPSTLGVDRRDPISDIERGISGLRLAMLDPDDLQDLSADVAADLERAKGILTELGAYLATLRLPSDLAGYRSRADQILVSEAYAEHAQLANDPQAPINETTRMRILSGKQVSAHDYLVAQRERHRDIANFLARLDGFDALILPAAPITAIPLSAVDEKNQIMSLYSRFANHLDLAALVVPIGLSPKKLPTSLQIIVRKLDDSLALRIGHAFEKARGQLA